MDENILDVLENYRHFHFLNTENRNSNDIIKNKMYIDDNDIGVKITLDVFGNQYGFEKNIYNIHSTDIILKSDHVIHKVIEVKVDFASYLTGNYFKEIIDDSNGKFLLSNTIVDKPLMESIICYNNKIPYLYVLDFKKMIYLHGINKIIDLYNENKNDLKNNITSYGEKCVSNSRFLPSKRNKTYGIIICIKNFEKFGYVIYKENLNNFYKNYNKL